MFQSLIELFPPEWRGTMTVLSAPVRWIPEMQSVMLNALSGQSVGVILLVSLLLGLPAALFVAGMWSTMLSLYTLPFRSGRGGFIVSLFMAWWDAGKCMVLYWTGIGRIILAFFGWVLGGIKYILMTLRNIVMNIFRSPLALLDWTSRRYFQPGVPWVAFLDLVVWCAVEATVFTFTLQPTLNEVFGGITGHEPDPRVMAPLLWVFLFLLIGGSFACVQVLTDAVKTKKVGEIVQMVLVESAVMFFEVIFLYRELIDAITPWIAQQSGGEIRMGLVSTLLVASFGWVGVRGMSWFLFGRYGTPALLAILGRQTITQEGGLSAVPAPVSADMWKAPIEALKKDVVWFKEEGKRFFELLTLPVLQMLAAALNFAVVVVQSRPIFLLPFKTLDDMLAVSPFASHRSEKGVQAHGRLHTPSHGVSRVAS